MERKSFNMYEILQKWFLLLFLITLLAGCITFIIMNKQRTWGFIEGKKDQICFEICSHVPHDRYYVTEEDVCVCVHEFEATLEGTLE